MVSVVLPLEVPPATRMFLRARDRVLRALGLARGHDPGGDVVVQREHGDRRLADREGRRRDHRRQQALETLPRLGQLGRDARAACMNLGANVMGDQPNDALAVGSGQAFAGVRQAARQPVDPQPAIGVEHHLDDRRIFEKARDRRTERRAQHARAARDRFRLKGMNCHRRPPTTEAASSGLRWG